MKVLWKCCIRSLKENQARTIVTIVGVAMATAMIMVLCCIGTTALATAIAYYKSMNGTAHETFYGVREENLKYFLNNQSIEETALSKTLGYADADRETDSVTKFVIKICGAEKSWHPSQAVNVTSGRLPEKEGEIVLDKKLKALYAEPLKLDDVITLTSKEGEQKSYQIVGFWERGAGDDLLDASLNDGEYWHDEETHEVYLVYCAYAWWEREEVLNGTYDVAVRFTRDGLWHRHEVVRGLLGVSEELYKKVYLGAFHPTMLFPENEAQLHARVRRHEPSTKLEDLEGLSPFHLTQATVWIITFSEVIFLVFVLAGVFCINNSFDVSITQRIRFFGMMASVGTTKHQRRMIVWIEAFIIGLFGIPAGILGGVGLSFLLANAVDHVLHKYLASLGISIIFRVAWWSILIALFQAVFMIALSAMEAAFSASKISPLEAVRSNTTIKSKGKMKKVPRVITRIFGVSGKIAWKNFQRAKIKYRATTVSIAVSVALFIGMSCLTMLFGFLETELSNQAKYQVYFVDYHRTGWQEVQKIAKMPGVTGCVLKSDGITVAEPKEDEDDAFQKTICQIYALDNASFEKLCMDNGIDPKEAKGKGLVHEREKEYQEGMVLSGVNVYGGEKRELPGKPVSVELAGKFRDETYVDSGVYSSIMKVFVDEDWRKAHEELFLGWGTAYLCTEDAPALVNDIKALDLPDVRIENFDLIFQMAHFMEMLIRLVAAGFLVLIILIGVTNVINAVYFNAELRTPELSRLRAMGMTRKQFSGMIFLEGLFIGLKGFFAGLVIGCLIHFGTYKFVASSADMLWEEPGKKFEYGYQPPVLQIVTCLLAVAGLLYLVMNVYDKKSTERNLIETIRNENL